MVRLLNVIRIVVMVRIICLFYSIWLGQVALEAQ